MYYVSPCFSESRVQKWAFHPFEGVIIACTCQCRFIFDCFETWRRKKVKVPGGVDTKDWRHSFTKSFKYLIKMEVLNLLRLFCRWVFPYISRIHTAYIGEYLHFRYLKCLVIVGAEDTLFQGPSFCVFIVSFWGCKCLMKETLRNNMETCSVWNWFSLMFEPSTEITNPIYCLVVSKILYFQPENWGNNPIWLII